MSFPPQGVHFIPPFSFKSFARSVQRRHKFLLVCSYMIYVLVSVVALLVRVVTQCLRLGSFTVGYILVQIVEQRINSEV